jgi:hypothetical protein
VFSQKLYRPYFVLMPLSAIFQLYHGDYVSSYENVTKMKISTTKIEK